MKSFVDEVAATIGGENIWACIQCGICTASCPVAGEMEYPPRKIIALIRIGMRNEVLSSNSMWHCLFLAICAPCAAPVGSNQLGWLMPWHPCQINKALVSGELRPQLCIAALSAQLKVMGESMNFVWPVAI